MEWVVVNRAVLYAVIAASAACSYGGSFVDCEVACTPSIGCPPGFACSTSEGVCRSGETTTACEAIFDGGVDGGADSAVDGGATSCPAVFGGGRYLFVNTAITWPEAEARCKMLDDTPGNAPYVHLVVINNVGELGQVMTPGPNGTWLGYTDSKLNPSGSVDAAKFQWITVEQPVLSTWASGQPDDGSGPRCAYRDSGDGLMHDRTCTNLREYVCECDQFPENPNSL